MTKQFEELVEKFNNPDDFMESLDELSKKDFLKFCHYCQMNDIFYLGENGIVFHDKGSVNPQINKILLRKCINYSK